MPDRNIPLIKSDDEFFAQNHDGFDWVFVDGLHLCEQVLRDVDNAVRWLTPGGCIVLHDCLPTERLHQLREQGHGTGATTAKLLGHSLR